MRILGFMKQRVCRAFSRKCLIWKGKSPRSGAIYRGVLGGVAVLCITPGCATLPPQEIDQLHRELRADWIVWSDGVRYPNQPTEGPFFGDCEEYHEVATARAKERGLAVGALLTPIMGDIPGHVAALVRSKDGAWWILDTMNDMPVRAVPPILPISD